ncbi:MAG: Ryanodine receptor Ryr [Acetatifactor sp.]|nr:Ryanodine receptor Ryr [Acetatifactor sp.]
MERYIPSPINTENVELSAELKELIERLAKNTHDVWAQQRLRDSWVYGPNRDDNRKTHPGLVAYEELQESEKAYDRIVVEQLIKAMLAMGYQITK